VIIEKKRIPVKDDGRNHPRGDKKGRPKKGQKMHSPKGPRLVEIDTLPYKLRANIALFSHMFFHRDHGL
jgi:hypothetical protein